MEQRPPQGNEWLQKRVLYIHDYTINRLRSNASKVGFLLQYGYFKVCNRFFTVDRFQQTDIYYVARILDIPIEEINLQRYKKKLPIRHQTSILEMLDYKPLNEENLTWLERELLHHVKLFTDPKKLFHLSLQLLHDRQIALPSYHQLSNLISQHYLGYEDLLLKSVANNVSREQQGNLETLLDTSKESRAGQLNQFKFINQSLKPKMIKASLAIFSQLANLFRTIEPVVHDLALTPQSCRYYATWVKKSKLSQVKQISNQNRLYLHLIAFCQHQYFLRQDTFIDIFLKSVQSIKNTANARLNKFDQLSRKERRDAVRHVTKKNQHYRELIDEISDIAKSTVLTDTAKLSTITILIDKHQQQHTEKEAMKIKLFEYSLKNIADDSEYFNVLEKLSAKLQNRVSELLKALIFHEDNSDKTLMSAINHYKINDGKLDNRAPITFLKAEEQSAVIKQDGKLKLALYKILLFIHIADAIKSGELNLKYSYRYLSIKDYLIDEARWKNSRSEILELAGLEHFSESSEILQQLKKTLGEKYTSVNRRLDDNLNPYFSFNKQARYHVNTPALDEKQSEHISMLLKQDGYVPIFQILSEVNATTQFKKSLTHHSIKNVNRYASDEACMAGIIGLGCNIGIPKMGQITTGVNESTLKNTVNWHFSKLGLDAANKQIMALIQKLSLPNVFIADSSSLHSASDGRKVNVAVDSLLANYSFKYFGKDKGVSIYTFIDERQVLFHSTVISASEREAAYVIDGINNNDVVKTQIHSTDTHGYSELVFAASHFMGVAFAPRIKNIGEQCIYAFSARSTYEKKGYQILPSRPIKQKLIMENWEDILRFMATIRLKEVSASQLFKRLSSYARDNPLYKAIKEFGRIIKSQFILTYFDDVTLRQRIEKQLNRIESSNKFSKAVFYANNGEFKQGTLEDQEIAVACKVLIQNSIVLWNYLYLSQLLSNCVDERERVELVGLIKEGSVVTWGHINLHGEFDFKRYAANDPLFDMAKILSLKLMQG